MEAGPISIAIYLPQFHPIPENDQWWGAGFTEWTNVGKAKPLYRGHYQPKVPADLGYYDLRLKEARTAQAKLAQAYGIKAFCYWDYWFGGGKRLLERPLEEVLDSGEPEFPICIGWANHSWEAKNWGTKKIPQKVLIEQTYPGVEDCERHFEYMSRAFKDKRYLKLNDKPIFVIWDPLRLPKDFDYLAIWRRLAIQEGLAGIHFIGFTYSKSDIPRIREQGFDDVLFDGLFEARNARPWLSLSTSKAIREIFGLPLRVPYEKYAGICEAVLGEEKTVPCVIPNYDHTPRSGARGAVLLSTPKKYGDHLRRVVAKIKNNELGSPLLFIKSWNEWGEGNYLEPDLRYGHAYLNETKKALE